MHESIIARSIIDAALLKANGKKIKSITIEVGDLGHVPAEEIKQAILAITDFNVKVKSVKADVKCVCGYYGEPKIIEKTHGHTIFECPDCGALPEVIKGEDIILTKIELQK
ncbi:MAG: hydrogenase/urease maturation nickel metallochaperone HypA [Candidatus Woesearchaeota archaeon]